MVSCLSSSLVSFCDVCWADAAVNADSLHHTATCACTDVSGKDQESKDTRVRKEGHGAFYMLPHYMKLHDILKGAYANYKVCVAYVLW